MFTFYVGLPLLVLVILAMTVHSFVQHQSRASFITAIAFTILVASYFFLLAGEWHSSFAKIALFAFGMALLVAHLLAPKRKDIRMN